MAQMRLKPLRDYTSQELRDELEMRSTLSTAHLQDLPDHPFVPERRHSPPTVDDVRRESASRHLRRAYGVVCLACRGTGLREDAHCAACDGVGRAP